MTRIWRLTSVSVWRLSVCLSLTSGLSRERRKTKIGTEVAHITRDSDTTLKVKRSRSPDSFTHRRVGASGSCSGGRGNMLAVRNCCYVAVCSVARGASAPTGEERGGAYRDGHPPTRLLYCILPLASDGRTPILGHREIISWLYNMKTVKRRYFLNIRVCFCVLQTAAIIFVFYMRGIVILLTKIKTTK